MWCFREKLREKQRLKNLSMKLQNRENVDIVEGKDKKSRAGATNQPKLERKKDSKKRRATQEKKDDDDMEEDYSLLKKLRRGRISQEELEKAMDVDMDFTQAEKKAVKQKSSSETKRTRLIDAIKI